MADTRIRVADGVWLRLELAPGAEPEPAERLARIDVSALPGAEVAGAAGWVSPGEVMVRAACVRAPSDRWAPGLEDLVLARATDLGRVALGAPMSRWDASAVERRDLVFDQRIDGELERGGVGCPTRGRHLLAFVGPARDAAVCSVVCVEPRGSAACAPVIDGARFDGVLHHEPEPSGVTALILGAATHPRSAAAAIALVATVGITWLLVTRPRPRW